MSNSHNLIEIAKINSAHGIRGEVKVLSYTEYTEDLLKYSTFQLAQSISTEQQPRLDHVAVERAKVTGPNNLIVKFVELHSRNDAEAARGIALLVSEDLIRQTNAKQPDEYYQFELMGLTVLDENQQNLGKVVGLNDYGAGPILEIAANNGGTDFSIPYNHDYIKQVDPDTGVIIVKEINII